MKKFDIYQVNLNPKKGHTQAGVHPAIIIQSDNFNPYSPTVIIVPLTSKKQKIFPGEFLISPSQTNGLSTKSRFLGHQIITIDKQFLGKKLGTLESKYFNELETAISIVLDMKN